MPSPRVPRGLSDLIMESSGASRVALEAAAEALSAVDPRVLTGKAIKLQGGALVAGGRNFGLGHSSRIYLVGGGKASGLMAAEAESILGDRLERGAVVVPDYQRDLPKLRKTEYLPSTHPLPTQKGVDAVMEMLEVASMAKADDLVVCLISGGGSALMPLPVQGVTLDDLKQTTRALLGAGATIQEINCVRKHLSELAGGRLVKRLNGATVLSLIISDVVGDDPGSIASGPTAPDPTTYADAVGILRKHRIWEAVPGQVSALLERGMNGEGEETAKDGQEVFARVTNIIVGSNSNACEAARDALVRMGVKVPSYRTQVVGEARTVGSELASLRSELGPRGGWGAVWGGETTVTLKGGGKGGRNQEVALAAAIEMDGAKDVAVLSLGTDGIDGPTDAAGAIADGETCDRARGRGLDPQAFLDGDDAYTFFQKSGGLVVIGPTGTNVSDVMIAVSGQALSSRTP